MAGQLVAPAAAALAPAPLRGPAGRLGTPPALRGKGFAVGRGRAAVGLAGGAAAGCSGVLATALLAAAAAARPRRRAPAGERGHARGRAAAGRTAAAGAAAAPPAGLPTPRRALLAPAALAGLSGAAATSARAAGELRSLGNGSDIGLELPEGFAWTEKAILLPTHKYEKRATANEPYGKWQIGVTVDVVNGRSVADLGSAEDNAQRLLKIERAKDGNISSQVISFVRGECSGAVTDTIEYRSDTTRGFYHYIVRVAIMDGKLHIFESKAPEEFWGTLEAPARASAATLRLGAQA